MACLHKRYLQVLKSITVYNLAGIMLLVLPSTIVFFYVGEHRRRVMKVDLLHWQLELWFITCLYYINVCELATNVYGAFYVQQFCIVTLSPISFVSLVFNDMYKYKSHISHYILCRSIPISRNETEFPVIILTKFYEFMKLLPCYECDWKLMDRLIF